MSTAHTPAEVLRAALLEQGLGVLPSISSAAWPIYVDHLPQDPNKAICIYDTSGTLEGRIQRTGETISKSGWQVLVRSSEHSAGWCRMEMIREYLDSIRCLSVSIDGTDYEIGSVSQKTTVLSLGQEPDRQRRNLFTLNGTISFEVTL